MKDSFGSLFVGMLLGAAAAVLYLNKEKEVVQKGRRVIAQSKRAFQAANNDAQPPLGQEGEME